MKQYVPGKVRLVKLFSHIGDDDNGKFQPLAFMNGKDPYDIFSLAQDFGRGQIELIFLHLVNELQVTEQAAVSCFFVLAGPFIQCLEIGLPHSTARHASDKMNISRIQIQLLQQLSHTGTAAERPPLFQMPHKILQGSCLIVWQGLDIYRQVLP